jgi:iron(III) transport system permease protein
MSPLELLRNTAVLAGGAIAIALPLGTLLAVLVARCDMPGRRVAMACLGLLLFLPLYVQLSAWDAAVGKLGWFSILFGRIDQPWLEGMRGAIWVHAMAAVPWVALIVGLGLAQVDRRQEESALIDASPLIVLWRITLPQCRAFVFTAALWVAVSTTSEMTVTNIYLIAPGSQTLTEQFYMTFSLTGGNPVPGTAANPPAEGSAPVAAFTAFVAFAGLVAASIYGLSRLVRQRVLVQAAPHGVVQLFRGRFARFMAGLLAWVLVVLLLGVPLVSLISKAGFVVVNSAGIRQRSWSLAKSVEVVAQVPTEFAQELQSTLLIALSAATAALVLAVLLTWPARRGGWPALVAIALAAFAMATPGPVIGVGLIHVFNQPSSPLLIWLYDRTVLAPALAQMIHALPLGIVLAWHSFATLSDDVLAAAALDGAGPGRQLWLIAIPQRLLALCSVWLAAFAVAAGDLAWSLLVIPPGLDTLQRRVFGLVHSGVEEQVAGICLFVMGVYALLSVAMWWLLSVRGQKRRGDRKAHIGTLLSETVGNGRALKTSK